MDKIEAGKKFESECILILNKIFDKVEWLSEDNHKSTYDFKCIKNGKEYNVEAKSILKKNGKPKISYNQRDVDMVVCKKGGEIFIYEKDTLLNNFFFDIRPPIKKTKSPSPNNKNIVRITRWANSKVLVLSPEFCKFHKLDIGDWVDVSDIKKSEDGDGLL